MVCASLRHRGDELLGVRKGLEAYASSGSTMGMPLLYPWANRIARRRFEVLGRTVDLDRAPHRFRDDAETGLPMHGARPFAWSVEHRDDRALRAAFDWGADAELMGAFPFAHRVVYEATLDERGLRVSMTIDAQVPVAFGFHPYFRLLAEPHIDVPVRERVVLDARKLPTGERAPAEPITGPLGGRTFDDAFAAPTGPSRLGALTVTLGEGFPYAQLFAPPGDERLVSLEPMTAPANALVTGEGLLVGPRTAAFAVEVR